MGFFSGFFFLTLVARTCIHGLVAVFAAKDLHDIHSVTKNLVVQIALKVSDTSGLEKAGEFPFTFYVICAATLFVLVCLHPWKSSTQARVTIYGIVHVLYALFVVYVIYIQGLMDISFLRDVYSAMNNPYIFPVSLVLDVLTIITACSNGMSKKPTDPMVFMLLKNQDSVAA